MSRAPGSGGQEGRGCDCWVGRLADKSGRRSRALFCGVSRMSRITNLMLTTRPSSTAIPSFLTPPSCHRNYVPRTTPREPSPKIAHHRAAASPPTRSRFFAPSHIDLAFSTLAHPDRAPQCLSKSAAPRRDPQLCVRAEPPSSNTGPILMFAARGSPLSRPARCSKGLCDHPAASC